MNDTNDAQRQTLKAWVDADDAYDREADQYIGAAWANEPQKQVKDVTDDAAQRLLSLRRKREDARKRYLDIVGIP